MTTISAKKVIKLLRDKGLKGDNLADALGVSRATVSDIENNRQKTITLDSFINVAYYLDISLDELANKCAK